MTKVINLFAGPGAGKSTTAAGLFHEMKLKGLSVEIVTEFAKDLTYQKNHEALGNQLTILGEQFNRMYRLKNQVDWIITDSPLLLGLMYSDGPFRSAWFTGTCMGAFDVFDNVNFSLRRIKEYKTEGRNQTKDQAVVIDNRVVGLLESMNIPFNFIRGDETAPKAIMEQVLNDK